ncbi:MAG TPA: HAD-IA family hydrolase [Acidimicrobiia bacterium]|nr:HAD-IA family hydrolase [Acidimicrobiia bacterium]
MGGLSGVRAAVFDVGETLVDETNGWRGFAAHAGVPAERVFDELDRAVAERRHHRTALEAAAGRPLVPGEFSYVPTADDLYPDAVPVLRSLIDAGFAAGIVGNQPETIEPFLVGLDLELALVGSSQRWGVEKPDPAFFERICSELGLQPDEVAYVGDRLDNDILPAAAAGLRAVLVVRGPWGRQHAGWREAEQADVAVEGLVAIPRLLSQQ